MAEQIKTNAAPERRSRCKALLTIARANLESWLYSPRTIVALVFMILLCYMEVSSFNRRLAAGSLAFHYTEMLFFVFYNGCNVLMMSTMLLIAVCEMPKRITFQYYALLRSTRREFLTAQIVYCLTVVLSALLIIAVFSSIFTLGHLAPGGGWSDDLRVLQGSMKQEETIVPLFFRTSLSPGLALCCAIAPMFCFWFTMLMILLFFSVVSMPLIGVLLYAFLLWGPSILFFEAIPGIQLPTQFALLRNLALPYREEGMQYFFKVLAGYAALNAVLIAVMYWRIQSTELVFTNSQKA